MTQNNKSVLIRTMVFGFFCSLEYVFLAFHPAITVGVVVYTYLNNWQTFVNLLVPTNDYSIEDFRTLICVLSVVYCVFAYMPIVQRSASMYCH